MSPDIDFEVPTGSQLEATPHIVVHMENPPDNDTNTASPIVPENTAEDDPDTTIVTDSSPVIEDTNVDPSPGPEADNTGEKSENITIIEGLRKEIREMHIQMENIQKDYASVVSLKCEASAKIHQLSRDIDAANLKTEQQNEEFKLMEIQRVKAQAKIDTLENVLKATLQKQSFASSSLETLVGNLQTFIQQLDSSIKSSTQQLDASIRNSTQTLANLLILLQPPAPPAAPAPEPPLYQAGGFEEFRKMFKEFVAAPFAFRGGPSPFPSLR